MSFQNAYNGVFIETALLTVTPTALGSLLGIPLDTAITGSIGLPVVTGNVTLKAPGSTTGIVQTANASMWVEKVRAGDIMVSSTVATDKITFFGFGYVQQTH